MTLGAPAALWGLLAIPALILLYLLRVRRRDHPVSSILLWQRSALTLAASRPVRRIERSLLLLLQVMTVAAVVLALARPAVTVVGEERGDLILVLDLSLSMRARDVSQTRFDRARTEALDLVSHLPPGQRSGIVAAGPRPLVILAPTEDRNRVRAALRALEPWDAAGDVGGAVLAAAELPGSSGRIVAWTDAARGGLPALPRVTYRILGRSADNVGITMFRIARDPDGARALVRLDNFGDRPNRVPLDVTHEGKAVYHETVDVPAGGSRTVVFPVSGSGEFRAHAEAHDVLPEDDVASAVLDPAPLPSVLLVSDGNPSLERILRILPVGRADATRSMEPSAWAAYGVVILDRVTPGPLPPGDYLLIAAVPPNLPVSAAGEVHRPAFSTWDAADPVLRFVDLSSVRVSRALALTAEGGRVLAGGEAPLLWAFEGGGIRALLLPFALQDSDLPQHVAFPVLIANSLAWLGGGPAEIGAGEPLEIPAGAGTSGELTDPAGHRRAVRAIDGMFPLSPLTRAGVYRLTTAAGTREITVRPAGWPAGRIAPGAAPAAVPMAGARGSGARPLLLRQMPVWPWVLGTAVAAVAVEWALATRRRGGEP